MVNNGGGPDNTLHVEFHRETRAEPDGIRIDKHSFDLGFYYGAKQFMKKKKIALSHYDIEKMFNSLPLAIAHESDSCRVAIKQELPSFQSKEWELSNMATAECPAVAFIKKKNQWFLVVETTTE